eukprot:COSAG02_NODE_35783_length_463_cov_1.140110_2_plen_24_part_01
MDPGTCSTGADTCAGSVTAEATFA